MTTLERLALDYHKAGEGTQSPDGEGEYGCPGVECLGVQRLVRFAQSVVEAAKCDASDPRAAAARLYDLETENARLRRKIEAGPMRPWIENDDPEVIACMGSVPACQQSGCQARLNVPLSEQIRQLIEKWRDRAVQKRALANVDVAGFNEALVLRAVAYHCDLHANELAALLKE